MKKRKPARKPEWQKETALERIELLFASAERELDKNPGRSRRYMELANRLALRYNLRLSPALKKKFCKECYSYLVPGKSCSIRLREGCLVIKCLSCGHSFRVVGGRKK